VNAEAPPTDHRPVLGSRNPALAHLSAFAEWARSRDVLSIGLSLIRLIPDPSREEFLGGLLRFIGYRDTLQVLRAWAPERRLLRQLAALSEHLVDFPDLALPSTAQPIHLQFGGQMELNYLAVQFSTRRAPSLTAKDQLRITCLRTWLLLKALEFARAGHRAERSLKHLCAQLRMALDDRGNGSKLTWFLDVVEPALSLGTFELSLQLNIQQRAAGAASTAAETIRSMQALLDNRPRPEPIHGSDWEDAFQGEWSAAVREADEPAALVDDVHGTGSLHLPSDEAEDELRLQEVDVSEADTPPQMARASRGIVLLSQEDLQYLPFAWNRLRSDELTAIKSAIGTRLRASEPDDRLLATITVLAWITRRSLQTIESLPLATVTNEEWQLDPVAGCLHRLPSRRAVRWRADERTAEWVRPLAGTWELQLHAPVAEILRSASQLHPAARCIGQLWRSSDGTSLETAFNRWCSSSEGLGRVSSGLLVRAGEQAAFEQSLDPTFARLVTSPSRAGIAGAGAYPSWPHARVAQVIGQIGGSFATMTVADPDRNGLGSELDPDDSLLTSAMAEAWERLRTLAEQPASWLEYHNHLTAYGVLMLLAATGARPVTSVFESSAQFDLAQGQVYLEDKATHAGRDGVAGRLVPLVPAVTDFLVTVYLPHLRHLAEGLRPQLPLVADEIDRQASGAGSELLPLFFLLRIHPDFDWLEVSESSLRSLGLLPWPLPLNLFRHRLASRLRTQGLDPELIDAQLGHAEAGSETFGDFSPRCWERDQPAWRDALQAAFALLAIQSPLPARLVISRVRLAPGYLPFPDQSLFGREARARERAARRDDAARRALEEIRSFVGARPVDSIPAGEWERLGRQMLLTEHNLRQPNAAVRYQIYEEFLQREWREEGRRPRLRKWLARLPQPQTAFRPEVIGVSARMDTLRTALDQAHAASGAPISKRLAAMLAALDLCVVGRVTSMAILQALARGDAQVLRLVLLERQGYLEYAEVLTRIDAAPVLRYAQPSRSVHLVDLALSAGKALDPSPPLPPPLQAVAAAAGFAQPQAVEMDRLLARLALQVEQDNALRLPGVIVATLAGRLTSYALPWEDWLRVRSGQARRGPHMESEEREPTDDDLPTQSLVHRTPIGIVKPHDREGSKRANHEFLRQVRAALTRYLAGRSSTAEGPDIPEAPRRRTNTDNSLRRDTRTAIQAIVQRPDPAVSVAVHALGAWTLHLLTRPYRKGLLDAASIRRYLDALAHGFVSFGYELDLADLDSDELTEFYRSVIEPDGASAESGQEVEAPTTSSAPRRNSRYVLQRLAEFHQFAQARYGLDTPDWAEVGEGLIGGVARPGTITEAEYCHAMQSLCSQPLNERPEQVREAFVLLLAYRFGLRGGEASSMRRADWVEVAGTTVVLVTGHLRKLKSRASQRQVPLLEPLSEHEQQVVRRWLVHWSVETGDASTIPLFFEDARRGGVADIRPIRSRIIAALRASTCSARSNLHHARHAYANRMALHLLGLDRSLLWPAHHPIDPALSESMQRATLLTTAPTRRAPWAVARLLGHASPITTFNSYLHMQFDWASCLVHRLAPAGFGERARRRKLHVAVDLDLWRPVEDYLVRAPVPSPPEAQRCTPALVLKYARLRAQGMPPRTAGEHCRMAAEDLQRIEAALCLAGRKLSPPTLNESAEIAAIALPQVLLGRIQTHRWSPLIDALAQREQAAEIPATADLTADAGQQVGRTRQLLLWTQAQFVQMREFLDWMGWPDQAVALYRPSKLDELVKAWASSAGFHDLRATRSDSGQKALQIDVAEEFREGMPPIIHPHRVAVVTRPENPVVHDNFEFILTWLAFGLSRASVRTSAVAPQIQPRSGAGI